MADSIYKICKISNIKIELFKACRIDIKLLMCIISIYVLWSINIIKPNQIVRNGEPHFISCYYIDILCLQK